MVFQVIIFKSMRDKQYRKLLQNLFYIITKQHWKLLQNLLYASSQYYTIPFVLRIWFHKYSVCARVGPMLEFISIEFKLYFNKQFSS